jgi:hypothetical protein
MRRRSSVLVGLAALALALGGCTSGVPAGPDEPRSVPNEVVFVATATGPLTLEVPGGTVLFERPGALASPDGSLVYSASPAGGRTLVETNDAVTGEILAETPVAGDHLLGVVSGSGRAVALVEPLPNGWDPGVPVPRSTTSIVVADPTGASEARTFELRGNYEPEAFSVDDDRLFMIQHLPAEAPEVYRVTMLDLTRGTVYPVLGPYKGPPERMPGTRLEQLLGPGRDRLYTLYTSSRPGYAPHQAPVPANAAVSFVHVLDLREGWAHCVGLPRQLWDRPAAEQAMAVSPDGSTLYVVDAAQGVVAAMDTSTLETRVEEGVAFGEVDGAAAAAVVRADGSILYVAAGGRSATLFAVDASTFEVLDRWAIDGRVTGLGLSGDGARLYVASGRGVSVLDPSTGEALAEMPLGETGPVMRISPVGG